MDKNRIKGSVEWAKGKVQNTIGGGIKDMVGGE